MAYLDKMSAYIKFGYKKFSRWECLGRVVLSWILSIVVLFMESFDAGWVIFLVIVNLGISSFFLWILFFQHKQLVSRLLYDGLFFLIFSLFFLLASNKLWAFGGSNRVVPFITSGLWVLLIPCCIFGAYKIMQSGKCVQQNTNSNISLSALGGTLIGIFVARPLLSNVPQGFLINLCASVFTLLSYLMLFCSVTSFLKVYLSIKYTIVLDQQ